MTAIAVLALLQLLIFKGKGCLWKGLLFTAVSGAGVLWLLSMAEPYLGFSLPLTRETLLFSSVLGIPAAMLLSLVQILQQLL